MKKLINAPDDVVRDALRGMEAAHSDRFRISYDPYLVVRIDPHRVLPAGYGATK